MARKRRKGSRRRRGFGSIISLRGTGGLKSMRKASVMGAAIPVLVGGGLAALTVLGVRYFTATASAPDENTRKLSKYAPAIALGAGAVGAGALYMFAGKGAAAAAAVSATAVAGMAFGADWLFTSPETAASVQASLAGIVLQPTGAIVAEPGQLGSYTQTRAGGGVEVNLGGVNTSAFGTPGFRI